MRPRRDPEAAGRIAERFDIAIISAKGMSTTAARLRLGRIAPRVDNVIVAHASDVSGFTILVRSVPRAQADRASAAGPSCGR